MAKLPLRVPHLGPKTRKVLQIVGFIFLALFTFLFAFQMVFPYSRVQQRIEELASSKVDLTIGEIERGWVPGRFFLKNVTVKTRPSAADLETAMAVPDPKDRDKAIAQLSTTVFIDKIEIDIGFLPFLKGTASVDFVATLGAGRISGSFAISKGSTVIQVSASDVPSQQLPMREVLSNLPMSGDVDFDFELDLPNEKLKSGKVGPDWTKAVGSAEFSCEAGCTIGDGKAKLKLKAKNSRSQAFAGDGTAFGKIQVQSLDAKIELKDGKVDITKFDTKSSDVDLNVDFTMTLAQNLDQSAVGGCIRFRGTEALRRREPKTADALSLTGAARHTDGLDHIKLEGTLKEVRKVAKVCGPGTGGGSIDSPTGSPSRPNLTVQPDEPSRPTVTTPPPGPAPFDAALATPNDATLHAPTPSGNPSVPTPGHGSAGSGDHSGSGSGSGAPEQPVPEGAGSGSG
ncbi:MAG: type II secretion system protein GspN [Deltaproteobacteria bacterium]|nr:type II secretion system protein GspN [Deltaproteobacteria bacterium]